MHTCQNVCVQKPLDNPWLSVLSTTWALELRSSVLGAIFSHRDVSVGSGQTRVFKNICSCQKVSVRLRETAQWLRVLQEDLSLKAQHP